MKKEEKENIEGSEVAAEDNVATEKVVDKATDKAEKKAAKATPKPKKKSKLAKAEEQVQILTDRLLRLQADFDNFRKRTLREKSDIYKRANEDLMEELLPVIDHMDMALQAAADHDAPEAFTSGFAMVGEQLVSALKKSGLAPIDTDGAEFDPNLHEAISQLPSDDVEAGHIMIQVRKGFMLGDRLLRPAQVIVSQGKSSE
jgi:molecular chaperone GrpE